jgi:hypothetical protein
MNQMPEPIRWLVWLLVLLVIIVVILKVAEHVS